MVFLIDNSGSMATTDPTCVRGMAAGLIMDSAALDSRVEAGLVLFNDTVETEGKLLATAEMRARLVPGPGGIPDPAGATNLEAGFSRALGLFQGSAAARRTMVLISDGNPATPAGEDPSQKRAILDKLVPLAKNLGVRVYALGLQHRVDASFLEDITRPTGGSTLLFRDSRQLLVRAKELVGRQDDVHEISNEELASSAKAFQFELPPGTDRARVTVILDDALRDTRAGFLKGQIDFALQGPEQTDPGSSYLVRKDDIVMVGAWTTFLSQPGEYRLQVDVTKPGITGHGGLRVYVEALSVLELEASLAPIGQTNFSFGEELQVEAALKSGDGKILEPGSYQLTGHIDLPTTAQEAIAFSGSKATFPVPPVLGTHRIVIQASTKNLGKRRTELLYRAREEDPCELMATPDEVSFGGALGPEDLEIEASFRVDPLFQDGSRPRTVMMAITGNSDLGALSLEASDGRSLPLDGRPRLRLEPEGLDLVAKIRLDPTHTLSTQKPGTYRGQLVFQAPKGGCDLHLPLDFSLRIPQFDLENPLQRLSFWWDPMRGRRVSLGRVTTDIVEPSNFTVELGQHVQASNKLGPIARLLVAEAGQETLESSDVRAGISRYGPIELPARGEVDLDLVLEPSELGAERLWTKLGLESHTFSVRLQSELGMAAKQEVELLSLGGAWAEAPWLGPLSPHGLHVARWLLLGVGVLMICLLARRRLGVWRRFWRYRPGTLHHLPSGELRIGEATEQFEPDFSLPAHGSRLRGASIASVRLVSGGLTIEEVEGRAEITVNSLPPDRNVPLYTGDSISIEADGELLWELEFLGFDEESRMGEVEIIERPQILTLPQILRKSLVSLAVLAILAGILSANWTADLAYSIPGAESAWLRLFGPGS